jgi:distribution and morphology protein 10
MGYTSTAYTAAVNPQLTCSTRFDFNLYSYESDLCIGAEWRNGGEGVVKGRFGFRQVSGILSSYIIVAY